MSEVHPNRKRSQQTAFGDWNICMAKVFAIGKQILSEHDCGEREGRGKRAGEQRSDMFAFKEQGIFGIILKSFEDW